MYTRLGCPQGAIRMPLPDTSTRFLALLVLATILPAGVDALSITPADFGPAAVVESFEGLSPGPGLVFGPDVGYDPGYLLPVTPFAFSSGVSLSDPDPNPSSSQAALVADPTTGFAQFGLGGNGVVVSGSQVPFGTAYLGFENPAENGGVSSITFVFPSPMLRVGAYIVSASPPSPGDGVVTILALDAGGATLESLAFATGNVSQWATSFAGIQRSEGIHAIRILGPPTVLDGLTFEVIPEPSTAILFASGLALFALRRTAA